MMKLRHERAPGNDLPSSKKIRPRFLSNGVPTFVPKGCPVARQETEETEAKKSDIQPSSSSSMSPLSKSPLWVWTVKEVPRAPPGVPLERTAIELQGMPLHAISGRISAFMKECSVNCTYRSNEARVDCSTCCGLEFVVQLWRKGTKNSDDDATPIILEVQRRKGCCIVMRSVRRLLISFVLKHGRAKLQLSSSSISNFFLEPKKRCVGSSCKNAAAAFNMEKSLGFDSQIRLRCLELLASDKMDCVRLGMETLLVLVNCTRAGSESAEEIAQALLFGKGDLVNGLRPAFLSLYHMTNGMTSEVDDDAVSVFPSLDGVLTNVRDFEREQLRLLSLKVLSCALEIVDEKEQDYLCNEATMMLDLSSNFWQHTLFYLLVRLEECEKRQHEAALAAKCFRILESLQPNALVPLTHPALVGRVSKAYVIGKQHHLTLEREAERLLKSLHLMSS
jgi:hypothetical protein